MDIQEKINNYLNEGTKAFPFKKDHSTIHELSYSFKNDDGEEYFLTAEYVKVENEVFARNYQDDGMYWVMENITDIDEYYSISFTQDKKIVNYKLSDDPYSNQVMATVISIIQTILKKKKVKVIRMTNWENCMDNLYEKLIKWLSSKIKFKTAHTYTFRGRKKYVLWDGKKIKIERKMR